MRAPTGFATISSFVFVFVMTISSASAAVEKKEWAILTFLNGFNNLDPYGDLDMNEMEKVGSTDRFHVVVQWASLKTRQAKRVYVNKDNNSSTVTSPVVENLGQVDMGDYRNLVDFVKWAARNYPAERYFVNIWNHGNGWHRIAGGPPSARDVSYDDLSGNRITTEQLGLASAEISRELGQKIDIMASDSCLMAMAEVVGQMKENIDHFIGSEEVEPADGWPYHTFLGAMKRGGAKSPTDVAKILTDAYHESYRGQGQLTLSGLSMAGYAELAASVRALGLGIRGETVANRKKILAAVRRTQSYLNDDYKDLGDLVDQIANETGLGLRPELLTGVKAALRAFVVANRTSSSYSRSQGVAIWFPDSSWQLGSYRTRYGALTFNRDTQWLDAIVATLAADTVAGL